VTTAFVERLEKELEYLEFQHEMDLKGQELLKSKQVGKEKHIHLVEVTKEKPQTEENKKTKMYDQNSMLCTKF